MAATRARALLDGKVDLVVLSRFAADRLMEEHPVDLLVDLGPGTYVGAHGLLLRHGVDLDFSDLRVAVDYSSEDLRTLAERTFEGRDVTWVETSYMQLRDLFARGEVDATVWNLDEVHDQLGTAVEVLPLDDAITRSLSLRNSSAAVIGRSDGAQALAAARAALDLTVVTTLQSEVLRGERIPSY